MLHRLLRTILYVLLVLGVAACGAEKARPLKIGDQAPDFEARDINGKPVSLASYKGSPVVLRFFLTDCPYCRADTPVFNEFYEKYRRQGLKIVYINNTGVAPGEIRRFSEELRIAFPVVIDADKAIAARFHVKALPQTIVLDPDQRIIGAVLGGVSEAELDRLLGPYL